MIIEAKRTEKIDVVIDPLNVLAELGRDFRSEFGVPQSATIMSGYWKMSSAHQLGNDWYPKEQIRLATVEEIEVMNALQKVAQFVAKKD